MKRAVTKSIIFSGCCCLCIYTFTIKTSTIVFILLALIVCCLDYLKKLYNTNPNTAPDTSFFEHLISGITLIYLAFSLFKPELFLFIPLLLPGFLQNRQFISIFLSLLGGIIHFSDMSPYALYVFLTLTAISIVIESIIHENESMYSELIVLRDTSREHELLAKKNIQMLQEQQNTSVYMATLKERNRIAREIHDNVGHMLTRSILQVGAIKTINKDTSLTASLNTLHDTLNQAMTSIRTSVHDLHDESIDLQAAIHDIISPVTKFHIQFTYDMSQSIPKDIKYSFITVVKEAVNNAIKHSNADTMQIKFQEHPGFYQLLIQDNGTDIDLNYSSGIGLTNMEERMKTLGGVLKISTENGFRIFISIIKNERNQT